MKKLMMLPVLTVCILGLMTGCSGKDDQPISSMKPTSAPTATPTAAPESPTPSMTPTLPPSPSGEPGTEPDDMEGMLPGEDQFPETSASPSPSAKPKA